MILRKRTGHGGAPFGHSESPKTKGKANKKKEQKDFIKLSL